MAAEQQQIVEAPTTAGILLALAVEPGSEAAIRDGLAKFFVPTVDLLEEPAAVGASGAGSGVAHSARAAGDDSLGLGSLRGAS